MTAKDIQRRLIVDRYKRNRCCPNYTPNNWFECDVFELTPSGQFREYEIKLTRADFRNDAKKEHERIVDGVRRMVNKYEALVTCAPNTPNRFYYVCPVGVITDSELPSWAGLIYCHPGRGRFPVRTELRKEAPRLHRRPIDEKIREHMETVFYWRFHNQLLWKNEKTELQK